MPAPPPPIICNLFGLVALGYMWCRIVEAANAKLAAGGGAPERLNAKLVTGRFFMERMLPETGGASRAHPGGRGEHDGAAGGGVLERVLINSLIGVAVTYEIG